ncbi:ABC transporter permease [Verrucomicrobia bacterium LW23]|nr:ABC transporter permease [Verrucomicrobia bacterium LW23]
MENELYLRAFANSFFIATAATVLCLIISVPLALAFARYSFPGKQLLQGAMLIPIILPPFVGAIGIKHFFARYGSLNLILMHWGVIPWDQPIDFFGNSGLTGVIIMEVLHLFPIMFLSLAASLANIDPSLRDAAANMGAKPFYLFRTVTLPLAMPGIFAGASIVFVSAFTDLGTPLIFDFQATVPTQIFNASTEAGDNPIGNALVVTTLVVVSVLFIVGKYFGDSGSYAMMSRSATHTSEIALSPAAGWGVTVASSLLLMAALMPHIGVIVNSFAGHWALTVLPSEWSAKYYAQVFTDDTTTRIIRNSLYYSIGSAFLDLVLGVAIAHLLARENFAGKWALDVVVMLPLALPGLVLAFGYLVSFTFSKESGLAWLNPYINPRQDPTLLLIVSYAVRRLPYIVRAAYAGYQQTSVTLEEASANLGASRLYTLWRITLPLIAANLVAGTILTFSFAMLEVSDSLLLAMDDNFAPITKGIYNLMGRPAPDAPVLASALGVLAMLLLAGSLWLASRLLGKTSGQLFRA